MCQKYFDQLLGSIWLEKGIKRKLQKSMNELRPKYKLLKQRLQISKKMLSLGFNIKILNQNILYIEKLKKTQIMGPP
jgi:hypothetical protein